MVAHSCISGCQCIDVYCVCGGKSCLINLIQGTLQDYAYAVSSPWLVPSTIIVPSTNIQQPQALARDGSELGKENATAALWALLMAQERQLTVRDEGDHGENGEDKWWTVERGGKDRAGKHWYFLKKCDTHRRHIKLWLWKARLALFTILEPMCVALVDLCTTLLQWIDRNPSVDWLDSRNPLCSFWISRFLA